MLSIDDINKLKEENAVLQAYKDVNEDFKTAWEELKAENARLKEVNQSLSMLGTDLASANETVKKKFFRADKNKDMWREKAENLQKTLQEIKKYIAKICKEECGYVQKKRCPDCDCRYGAILDLITKAEEE